MEFNFNIGIDDNFADVTITSARITKYFFGREVGQHLVYQLEMTDGKQTYETKLPVMIRENVEWEFRRGESRIVTEDDQKALWSDIIAKFPGYYGEKDFAQASLDSFVAWLSSGEATARVKIGRVTTDHNGVEHRNATIVKTNLPSIAPAKTEKTTAPSAPKAAKKSTPPSAPKPPNAAAKVYTAEDSWAAYESGEMIKTDPNGLAYWDRVSNIVGKDASNQASFTSEDWRKCVETFALPF